MELTAKIYSEEEVDEIFKRYKDRVLRVIPIVLDLVESKSCPGTSDIKKIGYIIIEKVKYNVEGWSRGPNPRFITKTCRKLFMED